MLKRSASIETCTRMERILKPLRFDAEIDFHIKNFADGTRE